MKAIIRIMGFFIVFGCLFVDVSVAWDNAYDFARRLKRKLKSGERVAVSYIYDGDTYDVTAYGNRWRDRLESALVEKNITVVPRKEVALLMEDLETFGEKSLESLWKGLDSDVMVMGCYYRKFSSRGYWVQIVLKAVRVKSKTIITAKRFKEKVSVTELKGFTRVMGNVRKQRIKRMGRKPLFLKAHLNTECFIPGQKAQITIITRAGVYLYIFKIAADASVTRIYLNQFFPEQPLPSSRFVFPPKSMEKKLSLVIRPYPGMDPAMESFRVVVSRKPLADEGFPVPKNRMLLGRTAGKLSELSRLIDKGEVSVVDLPYLVGKSCGSVSLTN